jgi:hypothetical protein
MGLLFVLVLRRGGDSVLLDYGLSRVVLYHANLLFVFGLSGWALVEEKRRGPWGATAIGSYGLVFLGFSLGSFQKLSTAPRYLAIPAVTQPPAWMGDLQKGTILLFETTDRDQVAYEAPYWHWLRGRTAFDTVLKPVPAMIGGNKAQEIFEMPVGYYAISANGGDLPEGMRQVAVDGGWRIFQVNRPFATRINSFWDSMQRRRERAAGRNPHEQAVERDWWLCSPRVKLTTVILELSSSREEDVELRGWGGTQTVRVKPGVPERIRLPLNPEFYTTPFQIHSVAPVRVRVVDEPKAPNE